MLQPLQDSTPFNFGNDDHGVTENEWGPYAGVLGKAVKKWKHRKYALMRLGAEAGSALQNVGNYVVGTEHHPFGETGGAGGIKQDRHLIARQLRGFKGSHFLI